jgi:pimeloyl-ACP methyl ester carboxylesterase
MHAHPQIKTVYCLPGQGADKRLFEFLQLDSAYKMEVIEYGTPGRNTDLKAFARELAASIDTSRPFALVGVSLGGMICAELAEILHPEKTILISSAKNRGELPRRYRFQKKIPVYKLFPGSFLTAGARWAQPIFEPTGNEHRERLESMLSAKDGTYMKRSIHMILTWDRTVNTKKIYHIHGTKDHTLPFKCIKDSDYVIPGGSHLMILTHGPEISSIVNDILKA